jgi:hypothetical protein
MTTPKLTKDQGQQLCDALVDMASGKQWSHYRETDRATTYMEALSRNTEIRVTELYVAKPGEGTWIHPRLAVDFARWISADFAVWMDALSPAVARERFRQRFQALFDGDIEERRTLQQEHRDAITAALADLAGGVA